MTDLWSEWTDAVRFGDRLDVTAWLEEIGIPYATQQVAGGIGADWILIDAHGYYRPHPEPDNLPHPRKQQHLALISPCLRATELVGLCAWNPALPDRYFMRDSEPGGGLLGHDAVDRALICDEPLFVHAGPLAWLQAGAYGVALLDWRNPFRDLGLVRRIMTNDAELARRCRDIAEVRVQEMADAA
ncbi:MAG: hypothetical protein ACFCVH_13845 [Alphaproteobacteria bacterium]